MHHLQRLVPHLQRLMCHLQRCAAVLRHVEVAAQELGLGRKLCAVLLQLPPQLRTLPLQALLLSACVGKGERVYEHCRSETVSSTLTTSRYWGALPLLCISNEDDHP